MYSSFLILYLLPLTLISSEQISSEDDSKLKYSICRDNDFTIDSGTRLMGTKYVYLISNNTVFNLQIKGPEEAVIDFQNSLSDWSDKIIAPIDLIRTDDVSEKFIQLANCELGKEWTINWDEDIYKAYKSSKTYDCGGAFEILIGLTTPMDKVETRFQLYYLPNKNLIKDIEVRKDTVRFTIRELNSSVIVKRYIRLVDEWETSLIGTTVPFIKILNKTITAGFIYDTQWYLFAGKHFCYFDFSFNDFKECKTIAIKDWITNCREEVASPAARVQADKKKQSPLVIFLVIIIVISFIIILLIIIIIIREVFKKRDTTVTRPSITGSGRKRQQTRASKESLSSLSAANTDIVPKKMATPTEKPKLTSSVIEPSKSRTTPKSRTAVDETVGKKQSSLSKTSQKEFDDPKEPSTSDLRSEFP